MKKVILLLLLLPTLLSAEVLSPPPISFSPRNIDHGYFPSVVAWTSIEKYHPQASGPNHNWDYDLGARFFFYNDGLVYFGGQGRMIHRNQLFEENQFYFWPSSLITDLQLFAGFSTRFTDIEFRFRHDCKHDIDISSRRDAIHDALGIIFHPSPNYVFTQQLFLSGSTGFEYIIPPVIQGYDLEADIFSLWIDTLFSLRLPQGFGFPFFRSRAVLFRRRADTQATGIRNWDMDYILQAGWSFGESGGIRIFGQFERQSDDWYDYTVDAYEMFSIGLLLFSQY
ncbi:MAG: hypothetical protein ACLFR1_12045 [Spirochaetia bacterium]